MSSLPKQRFTPEQYLALEREAEYKSEYYDGEIFAMSGASRAHILVTVNIATQLNLQLKGRPCETYVGDMRVKVSPTGLYTYPDIVVVCGEPVFEDGQADTLVNPTVLIEVLSPTSEDNDRGRKFGHYRRIESLEEYIVIAQDEPRVEQFVRQAEGHWLLSEASGLEQTLLLPSISGTLSLADVYDRVRFGPEGAESQP